MERYKENFGIMTKTQFQEIAAQTVMIVGLGGLGGHVANGLARLGVKKLILVDDDHFETHNLNRQLFSNDDVVGQLKVTVISHALKKINKTVEVRTIPKRIEAIDLNLLDKVDWIVDAVDSIPSKLFIEALASQHRKRLLHGAVGGWYAQVGIIEPNQYILKRLYESKHKGIESVQKSPTFTPGVAANMMCCEWVKYLTNQVTALTNKLLFIDLLNHKYNHVNFSEDDSDD